MRLLWGLLCGSSHSLICVYWNIGDNMSAVYQILQLSAVYCAIFTIIRMQVKTCFHHFECTAVQYNSYSFNEYTYLQSFYRIQQSWMFNKRLSASRNKTKIVPHSQCSSKFMDYVIHINSILLHMVFEPFVESITHSMHACTVSTGRIEAVRILEKPVKTANHLNGCMYETHQSTSVAMHCVSYENVTTLRSLPLSIAHTFTRIQSRGPKQIWFHLRTRNCVIVWVNF